MGLSISHLIVILLIVLVVFGAGKLPQVMADLGKGLRAFKDAMKKEENDENSTKLK
ncbi:MAG: twin-arginine translocase TatA/TatE family subunit [Rickettsiaceae bacterium]|nr:twin-arginine translocase TatA/TatE family subunit [Rickettsiaceae bacterium]